MQEKFQNYLGRLRGMGAARAVLSLTILVMLLGAAAVLGQSNGAAPAAAQGATASPTASPTPSPVSGQPVQVTLTASNSGNAVTGQAVTFTANATTPNTGQSIVDFRFDFGDGSTAGPLPPTSSTGQSATLTTTHTYTAGGPHEVIVTARDSSNQTGNAADLVTVGVQGQALQVTFTAAPAATQPNQTVTFTYSVTTPNTAATIRTLLVNYGDGTGTQPVTLPAASASSPNTASGTLTHSFTTAGTFTASLTAADSSGAVGQGSTQVAVTNPTPNPVTVAISCTPNTVTVGQNVNCTVSATPGTPNATVTNINCTPTGQTGASAVQTSTSFTRSFSAAGAQTITCTVTDSSGGTGTGTTTISVTAAAATASPTPAPTSSPVSGVQVTYPAGWNIVAGPNGTVITGNVGPLYTYQNGDVSTGYEVIPNGSPLQAGKGYWAFFATATTVTIPTAGPQSATVNLPAGTQYIMLGNPGNGVATVTAPAGVLDQLVVWDAVSQAYVNTTMLQVGQGGFAFSFSGGPVTITTR